MAEQNEKVLFKLAKNCYPKYNINFFIHQESDSTNIYSRDSNNTAHILINTHGKVIYKSSDILNWNSNKIKLYFDNTLYSIY